MHLSDSLLDKLWPPSRLEPHLVSLVTSLYLPDRGSTLCVCVCVVCHQCADVQQITSHWPHPDLSPVPSPVTDPRFLLNPCHHFASTHPVYLHINNDPWFMTLTLVFPLSSVAGCLHLPSELTSSSLGFIADITGLECGLLDLTGRVELQILNHPLHTIFIETECKFEDI